MAEGVKNPLSGAPHTVQSVDASGHPQFEISPAELTPLRAKALGYAKALLIMGVILLVALILAYHPRLDLAEAAIVSAVGLGVYAVTSFLLYASFVQASSIVMTTKTISVRRWYGWQRFDRNIEHRFALLIHDRAEEERLRIDLEIRKAAKKGKVIQPATLYGNSCHLVLVYAGHREDLLTVYGHVAAAAVIARIQYCDRCLNEAMNMGGGINAAPEDEWNDAPGGLDNERREEVSHG